MYSASEGFRLDVDADDNSTVCNLYADLDFNDTCDTSEQELIYIPYQPINPQDFLPVQGVLTDQSSSLAIYPDKNVTECSALCKKTLYCSSFYALEAGGDCRLHRSSDFHRSQGGLGLLYISVDMTYFLRNATWNMRYARLKLCMQSTIQKHVKDVKNNVIMIWTVLALHLANL